MPSELNPPTSSDNTVPPPLPAPPANSAQEPANRGPGASSLRGVVSFVLSLCVVIFLADGFVSLADDSLILLTGNHALSIVRLVSFVLVLFVTLLVYVLMALTPLIPKRVFLPLTLFGPMVTLLMLPVTIYYFARAQQAAWLCSFVQVIFGLAVYFWCQGGIRLGWPRISENRLGTRNFSWLNLLTFVLVNLLIVAPGIAIYLAGCASLAVSHHSDGFLALRREGLIVQVRRYTRDDGKIVELVPMAHVGDPTFYQRIARSFPTNATVLMEGVSDERNLITNHVSYERMAASLGVAEQHEAFQPQGNVVPADVDVEVFSPATLDLLNLVMAIHAKGVTPENVARLMQYPTPPHFEEQLFDDLLVKRNRHVLKELESRLPEADYFILPWGAAHMPGLAKEILKSGFHVIETKDYVVIRFGSRGRAAAPVVNPAKSR